MGPRYRPLMSSAQAPSAQEEEPPAQGALSQGPPPEEESAAEGHPSAAEGSAAEESAAEGAAGEGAAPLHPGHSAKSPAAQRQPPRAYVSNTERVTGREGLGGAGGGSRGVACEALAHPIA